MHTLQERLVWAREQLDMQQSELAGQIGLHPLSVEGLESGVATFAQYLVEIASALGVSAYWLSTGIGLPYDGIPNSYANKITALENNKPLAAQNIHSLIDRLSNSGG